MEGNGCHRLWKQSDLDTELRAGTNRLTWRAPSLTLQVVSAICSGELSTGQNFRHQVSSTLLLRQGFPPNMKPMDWLDCLANELQGSLYLCSPFPQVWGYRPLCPTVLLGGCQVPKPYSLCLPGGYSPSAETISLTQHFHTCWYLQRRMRER